jgi:hypothetical protein
MSRKQVEIFSDVTERSLISAQSGSVIFINLASNHVTLNLPPPEAGLYYEFVITDGTKNFILNSVNNSYAVSPILRFKHNITNGSPTSGDKLTATTPTAFDRILVNCDGTNWFGTVACDVENDYMLSTL